MDVIVRQTTFGLGLVVLLVTGPAVTPLAAQSSELPTSRLVAGSMGGTLLGATAGGAVGWALYHASGTGHCEIGGAVAAVGAGVGANVGAPMIAVRIERHTARRR